MSDFSDTVDMYLTTQETLDIVKLLEDNEKGLNLLYDTFAAQYPEHSGFWGRIARDENDHASWLSELYEHYTKNNLRFKKDRFNKENLENFYKYCSELIKRANDAPYSILEAASLSVQLEDSMIEKKFFEVFEADTDLLKVTLNKLEESTEIHYSRILQFLKELKAANEA